jgi:hypothetical protein
MRRGRPARYRPSVVRSSSRQDASSEVKRCAVEIGRPASWEISVRVCSLPSVNVMRIDVILFVTDRPASVEFPAIEVPLLGLVGRVLLPVIRIT